MRVLFMGTPEIAVPSLRALAEKYDLVGVVCQTDKPAGRKRAMKEPPVKTAAIELGVPVFQPRELRSIPSQVMIRSFKPDIVAVMAYGKILPENILNIPRYGCINAHASLLPAYRGAAPVQYAIMNGDAETGVTIMKMDKGLDTGDILFSKKLTVGERDDAESLFAKISVLSAEMLPVAVEAIAAGKVLPAEQDHSAATYAPPITKADALFDFSLGARETVNRIRGLCVWPAAYFETGAKTVKVFRAEYSPKSAKEREVISTKPLTVAAGNGSVVLLDVMPSGGRRMDGTAFAAGLRLKKGDFI